VSELDDLLEEAAGGLGLEDEDDYDPSNITCPQCHQVYSGTDRSGGHCRAPLPGGGLCCLSFGSETAGVKHRVPSGAPGRYRCLTPAELTAKGWTQDDRGAWRTPPPKNNPWKKEKP
jgi:hypothetical protein